MATENLSLAGFLADPTEDSVFVLRPALAHLEGVVLAVWEQEDPWGVAGLLAVVVDRDGTWFAVTDEAFAFLRGERRAAPAVWLSGAVSDFQPGQVHVIDGGNAAVRVALGGDEAYLPSAA